MKKFVLTIAIAIFSVVSAFAQVPNEMMYQVMVIHGLAAPQDVNIEIQIRQSQNGAAIWTKTFELKDVKNKSVQNLTLDFGDAIDWSQGEYWIATIIDGEEKGCAKITSVPYAFYAKNANVAKIAESVKVVEGVITKAALVGTWKKVNRKNDDDAYFMKFNEDGTLTTLEDDEGFNYGEWHMNAAGDIYCLFNKNIDTEGESHSSNDFLVLTSYFDCESGSLFLTGYGRMNKYADEAFYEGETLKFQKSDIDIDNLTE